MSFPLDLGNAINLGNRSKDPKRAVTGNVLRIFGNDNSGQNQLTSYLGYDTTQDGPVLFGNSGGKLSSSSSTALIWDAQGNVYFGENTAKPIAGTNDLNSILTTIRKTPGPVGPAGIQGLVGHTGLQGLVGPVGPAGTHGLRGNDGAVGKAGSAGLQGLVGHTGLAGLQGLVGPVGPAGTPGLRGNDGAPGLRGNDGGAGKAGAAGLGIKSVSYTNDILTITMTDNTTQSATIKAPVALLGATVPIKLISAVVDATNNLILTMNDKSVVTVKLPSNTGLPGAPGAPGKDGSAGLQGLVGHTGLAGLQGLVGPVGPAGTPGLRGNDGGAGKAGAAGLGIKSVSYTNDILTITMTDNTTQSATIKAPVALAPIKLSSAVVDATNNLILTMSDKSVVTVKLPSNTGLPADIRSNSVGRDGAADWFRIFGTTGAGTALYNGLSIGAEGGRGLSVGDWRSDVPAGAIRATGNVDAASFTIGGKPFTGAMAGSTRFKVRDEVNGITINTDGAPAGQARMNIFSEDELYVLNKKGMIIGKEWGGTGNLNVQGQLCVQGTCIDGATLASFIKNNDSITLRSDKNGDQKRVQRRDDNVFAFANNNRGEWAKMFIEKL